jgi:hypothetical protein
MICIDSQLCSSLSSREKLGSSESRNYVRTRMVAGLSGEEKSLRREVPAHILAASRIERISRRWCPRDGSHCR